jgi:hypothetical protein
MSDSLRIANEPAGIEYWHDLHRELQRQGSKCADVRVSVEITTPADPSREERFSMLVKAERGSSAETRHFTLSYRKGDRTIFLERTPPNPLVQGIVRITLRVTSSGQIVASYFEELLSPAELAERLLTFLVDSFGQPQFPDFDDQVEIDL